VSVDTSKWSGEGTFTQVVIDRLTQIPEITAIRVEDAPASRSEADYNFVSNEIYVTFSMTARVESIRRWGFVPGTRTIHERSMTMPRLEATLTAAEEVGPPDYSDEAMLQYLRTERIVPPYQTRGFKLVELVRIYEVRAEG
jgi:hypothetical protein